MNWKSLNNIFITKINQLRNLASKKWSDSAFLGYEKWSGSIFLGYKKWSYSGFLGYNYYEKYLVFLLFLHGFGSLWKSNHILLISEYSSMAYVWKNSFWWRNPFKMINLLFQSLHLSYNQNSRCYCSGSWIIMVVNYMHCDLSWPKICTRL